MDEEVEAAMMRAGAQIEALQREIDALRKDAERYRWLQASKAGTIRLDGDHTVPNDLRWAAPQYVNWGNGLTLNAAVDAAMAADQSIGAA